MSKKLIGLGVVALLAVAVIGVTFPKVDVSSVSQGPQGIQGPQGPAGPQGERGPAGSAGQSVQGLDNVLSALISALRGLLTTLSSQPSQKLGAIPGPNLPTETSQGLLNTGVISGNCADATSTLAVLTNPFTATSTVTFASVEITQPATTSILLNMATTSLPGYADVAGNATTTGLLNRVALAAKTSTTTLFGYSGSETVNDAGFGSRLVQVAPRAKVASSTTADKLILSAIARGSDDLAGVTNTNNNFKCRYAVEFKALR